MSLLPQWYNRLPSLFGNKRKSAELSKWFENLEDEISSLANYPSGLSIASDDKYIYISADVPGLTADEVEVSVDTTGVLWVKGERKEENEEDKKFYRMSQQIFSYCIPLGDDVDLSIEPKASCTNGVMKIRFTKKKEQPPVEAKKIKVSGQSFE